MYHNQNDYGHVPYPAKGYESATVKTSGCGVCVTAMALEDLLGTPCPVDALAAYAIDCGARVPGGTNMRTLCQAVARTHSLSYETSDSTDGLLAAIDRRKAVIVNVGGDRTGYIGLFSSGGHYVYARQRQGSEIMVWDPGYYAGKFDKPGREGKVTVDMPDILADAALLAKDADNRSPRYYILENPAQNTWTEEDEMVYQTVEEVPQWGRSTIQKLVDKGLLQGDGSGLNINETMLRILVINDRAGLYD